MSFITYVVAYGMITYLLSSALIGRVLHQTGNLKPIIYVWVIPSYIYVGLLFFGLFFLLYEKQAIDFLFGTAMLYLAIYNTVACRWVKNQVKEIDSLYLRVEEWKHKDAS